MIACWELQVNIPRPLLRGRVFICHLTVDGAALDRLAGSGTAFRFYTALGRPGAHFCSLCPRWRKTNCQLTVLSCRFRLPRGARNDMICANRRNRWFLGPGSSPAGGGWATLRIRTTILQTVVFQARFSSLLNMSWGNLGSYGSRQDAKGAKVNNTTILSSWRSLRLCEKTGPGCGRRPRWVIGAIRCVSETIVVL
jgi:hypothetical protein